MMYTTTREQPPSTQEVKHMIMDYNEYMEAKRAFFKKHKGFADVDTTPMDQYNRYSKTYTCEDGAQWSEHMSYEWEIIETEVKKVHITTQVKLFRTEFYNTDNAESNYYYEQDIANAMASENEVIA